jgi:short-subunit dehydrogenase
VLLNAAAVVDMTRAFLPAMLEAGRGGIINVASMAAFQPLPYMSVYAATKAFVLAFSAGVRAEVRRKGVNVLCVCPGPVDTPFFEATGNPRLRGTVPKVTMMTADAVVSASLKAFKAGRGVVVPGFANKLVAAGVQWMPREFQTAMTAAFMKR